jgi:hypothetical protein
MYKQLSLLELKEQFRLAEVDKLILAFAIKNRKNYFDDDVEILHVKLFSDKCVNQMPKLLDYLATQKCVQYAKVLDNDHLAIYIKFNLFNAVV